jgi:metal-responsive CopG/Arc/MetJ family transcriptional regulator
MNYPIPATQARMGRPPMNVKPMLVRLGEDVPERIDQVLAPKEKRADLIREAVEREIKRRERAKER